MNDQTLLPDDPRITAYALGELDGADRARVERALRDDPALRAQVEEIRATASQLESALAEEIFAEENSLPPTVDPLAAPAASPMATVRSRASDRHLRGPWAQLFQFPQLYFVVSGLAAACFVMYFVMAPPPPSGPAAIGFKTEKVLVDMSKLVPVADGSATRSVSGENATPTPPAGAASDAGTVANSFSPPRALLDQGRDSTAGGALSPSQATGETSRANPPANSPPQGPSPLSVKSSPARGLAASGNGGMIFNESRGLPGARPREFLKGTDFADAVANDKPEAPADAALSAATPASPPSTGGGKMYLPAFTMSAERLRSLRGASAVTSEPAPGQPAEKPAAAVRFAPQQLTLLPSRSRGGRDGAKGDAPAASPDNDFVSVAKHPESTFSIDDDSVSYTNVRRFLQAGRRPPRDAVRIEELLNYFPYHYPPPPAKSDVPFATSLEVAEAPWAPAHRLVRIGLKGREVTTAERPAANLVFLLDVSASMAAPNRLPLAKESMRMLVGRLRTDDRVAIVTYAAQSSVALPSTPVARAVEIVAALDGLVPGGSTNGVMGLQLAYEVAKANFVTDGINRVILCTDGDFSVGAAGDDDRVRLVEENAQSGLALTVLGFGLGRQKDLALEKLAEKGNGHYGAIDSRREADKVLVQQVNGTLVTIAKDVKVQVEFNPSLVASYRLIGYEDRVLTPEYFGNDKVDAGEIGAGHTVTALYEVVPLQASGKVAKKDGGVEYRPYAFYSGVTDHAVVPGRIDPRGNDLLLVKVRYKKPDGVMSRRLDFPMTDPGGKFSAATPDFKFAAAVAGFGMILRDSPHRGTATMASVVDWALEGQGDDPGGYRAEFVELARRAEEAQK